MLVFIFGIITVNIVNMWWADREFKKYPNDNFKHKLAYTILLIIVVMLGNYAGNFVSSL